MLAPGGTLVGRYDKAHLVPYGEYLPMRPCCRRSACRGWRRATSTSSPARARARSTCAAWGKVGIQICYEIIFSGEVVDRSNRPDYIFNPSNDGWFGSWGPPQHLAQARLRAIEEGLPVLRSTPTGISAVIDARGAVRQALPWRTAGVIDGVVPPARRADLFARFGNVIPLLLALRVADRAPLPWRGGAR